MEPKPFGGQAWPLAPAVVDYIAPRILLPIGHTIERGERFFPKRLPKNKRAEIRTRAREALKEALFRGDVHARGPVDGAHASKIDTEFWRFAATADDGSAVDLSFGRKLPWFEVNAADVLRLWPAEPEEIMPAPAPEDAYSIPPRKVLSQAKAKEFVRSGRFKSQEAAHTAAVNNFSNNEVPRRLIRAAYNDAGLKRRGGRPRKHSRQ
jgi:hypothetical protein